MRKTWRSKSEEKVVGFSSASLFLSRKREAITREETLEIDHPTRRITRGAGIVKGWEDKLDRGRISDTSPKTKIRRARAPRGRDLK